LCNCYILPSTAEKIKGKLCNGVMEDGIGNMLYSVFLSVRELSCVVFFNRDDKVVAGVYGDVSGNILRF
jgi:hypothetical protein